VSSDSPHDAALRRLLALPWTVVPETTPEGDRLLRVREVPSAVGHGETDEELERDLWESLTASLEAYLHFGDPVPLPTGSPDWSKIRTEVSADPVSKALVSEPSKSWTAAASSLSAGAA
jgi:predicted RNase H-like HicB family nuclease